MPSQSRNVARTPGEAASSAPSARSTRSATTTAGASRAGSQARRARRPGSRATRACTTVARSGVTGHGDVLAQGEQLELELGHGVPTSSTPACARRRSSAREVRDLTVPRRQPSAAAVSSSESSSR